MGSRRKQQLGGVAAAALAASLLIMPPLLLGQTRVIEILADKDSRFKIVGQSKPQIVVKAGETIVLRIEARRGKTWSRDGAIHGFTLLRAKDHHRVDGWDLELMPGKQEFTLTAPAEPGKYEVLCTVVCSDEHEGMRMKFLVEP